MQQINDFIQKGSLRELESSKISNEINAYISKDDWVDRMMEIVNKGGKPPFTEQEKQYLERGFANGDIRHRDDMDEIIEYIADKREQQHEWNQTRLEMQEKFANNFYGKDSSFETLKNFQLYVRNEVNDDFSLKILEDLLKQYQFEYQDIFNARDPKYHWQRGNEEERKAVLMRFYENEVIDPRRETEFAAYQASERIENSNGKYEFELHTEADRYFALVEMFNNPNIASMESQLMIEAIKNDPAIREEDKLRAYLTMSDNNLVRQGLLNKEDAMYYNPNFSLSEQRQSELLQDAGFQEKPLTTQQLVFTTLYSNPMQSLMYSLPEELQDSFKKVINSFEATTEELLDPIKANDYLLTEKDYKNIEKIRQELPDEYRRNFDKIFDLSRDNLQQNLDASDEAQAAMERIANYLGGISVEKRQELIGQWSKLGFETDAIVQTVPKEYQSDLTALLSQVRLNHEIGMSYTKQFREDWNEKTPIERLQMIKDVAFDKTVQISRSVLDFINPNKQMQLQMDRLHQDINSNLKETVKDNYALNDMMSYIQGLSDREKQVLYNKWESTNFDSQKMADLLPPEYQSTMKIMLEKVTDLKDNFSEKDFFERTKELIIGSNEKPQYIQEMERLNGIASEKNLSNDMLMKIHRATEVMTDNGKNKENLATMTNERELALQREREMTNDLENKLGYGKDMKMRMNP